MPGLIEITLERWQSMWRLLGASGSDDGLFGRLVQCYSEPHRKYHTLQHLQECFGHLDSVGSLAERAGEVELALWFHDAIYDTRKKDNEERSAQWAHECALSAGLTAQQVSHIQALVMATKHNAVPTDRDAMVLVDIDLGILGSDYERFEEYEAQVREEYSWVPGFLYRSERRKVLQEFANRRQIYNTELFQSRYEAQARDNIARSLARL
jgi:predicted metal-dependent HD superfamily phosphohydrolase